MRMDAREHPPQCHGNSEAKELYNSLFIGTLEKHPRFSLHCYTNPKDDSRLVVTDYFLNQDDFGKIHFEGDHKVHVIKVTPETLKLDRRFKLDFDKEFKHKYPLGARPHGIAMK